MELNEFIEANNRLEKYYEKEYTNDQMMIMYEELKNLSVERYKRLISQCIKTCKYMPKVADILKLNTDLIDQGREEEKRDYFLCDKCDKTGYVFFTQYKIDGKRKIPYTYAAKCTCENAKYANKKIPTYKEVNIEIAKRINQVKDTTRDMGKIKDSLVNKW